MNVKIEDSWKKRLAGEFEKPYFANLVQMVRQEYSQYRCYPPGPLIFNAFNLCPFDKVKVVIIGQDPYHEPGQAMGLSFSVPDGVPMPPSLINIFKEIEMDLGKPMPASGNLTRWAEQGVMLLNATLTVRAHLAGSHQRRGWETFTDAAIKALSDGRHPMGWICTLQGCSHRPDTTPRRAVGAPVAAVCQQRGVVRQPPLLTGQCLPASARTTAYRLVKG